VSFQDLLIIFGEDATNLQKDAFFLRRLLIATNTLVMIH